MSKGNTWENDLLKLLFNNTDAANIGDATGLRGSTTAGSLYVSLHTADPGEAGDQTTNEIAYTSYARVAVARNAAWTVTNNSVSPAANIDFPAGTGGTGTATHFGVATGQAITVASGAGASDGTSTATAAGISTAASVAASDGTTTATATGSSTAASSVSSDGVGTASATGAATTSATASAEGTCTHTATGAAFAASTASAAGTSTADGVGEAQQEGSIAAAAGTSTVAAVALSWAASAALAAGTSSATGPSAVITAAPPDRWIDGPPSGGFMQFGGRRRSGVFGPW